MKNYFKKYLLFVVTGMLVFTSCEEPTLPVDTVVDGVTRGAALRTVVLVSNQLPIGDETARFEAQFEVQDIEQGTLVDNINVYIGFNDNTVESGAPDLDVPEALFATLSSADFTEGPFGLPRTSFMVTLDEMLQFTGVNESDLFGGDFFPIRFELVLSDGRTFSSTNSNANNLGGSFYNSPFIYFPTVICPVPETAFVGTYTLTQENDGIFGAVIREEDVAVTAASSTQRSIAGNLYPQFNGGAGFDDTFTFDLICNSVVWLEFDTGLTCVQGGDGIIFSPTDETPPYDLADDSSFSFVFFEDGGACEATATVRFSATKVE